MKKVVLACLAGVVLAGCSPQEGEIGMVRSAEVEYKTLCIEGVKYLKGGHGYEGYMAIKIDRNTLKPERCRLLEAGN